MNTRLHLESLDDRTLPSVTSLSGMLHDAAETQERVSVTEEPTIVVRYEVASVITTEQSPETHTPDVHTEEKPSDTEGHVDEEKHPAEEGHGEKKDGEHPTGEGHKEKEHEEKEHGEGEHHDPNHDAGHLLIEIDHERAHHEHELHLEHERHAHAHAPHEDHAHAAHGGHEHAHEGGHGEGHGGHPGDHGGHHGGHGGEHGHGGHEEDIVGSLEGEHGDEHGEGEHGAHVVHVGAEGHATGLTEVSTEDVEHGGEQHGELIAEIANHGREAIVAAADHAVFSRDAHAALDGRHSAVTESITASPTISDVEAALALGAFESFPGTDLAAAASAGMLMDERKRLLTTLLQDLDAGMGERPLPLDTGDVPEEAAQGVFAGDLAAHTATATDVDANNDLFATFHAVPDFAGADE